MTTDKEVDVVKIICSVLAALTVLVFSLALTSCADKDKRDADEVFEQLMKNTESSSETAKPTAAPKPFAAKTYVVVPEDATGELARAAQALAEAIEEKTGVTTVFKYEKEDIYKRSGEVMILIGRTEDLSTKEALQTVKQGEYVCKWDNDKLVICGRDEQSTLAAIAEFTAKVVESATYETLMPGDMMIKHKLVYEFDSIVLNEYNIYDYTMVYPSKSENRAEQMCAFLRDMISHRSGYSLVMLSEDEAEGSNGLSKKIIYVGTLPELDAEDVLPEAFVQKRDNGVHIYGKDTYSLSVAVAEFCNMLMPSGEENVNVTLNERKSFYDKAPDIEVMVSSVNEDQPMLQQIHAGAASAFDGKCIAVLDALPSDEADEAIEFSRVDGVVYNKIEVDSGRYLLVLYRESNFAKVEIVFEDGILCIDVEMPAGGADSRFRIVRAFENELTQSAKEKITELCQDKTKLCIAALEGENTVDFLSEFGLFSIVDNSNGDGENVSNPHSVYLPEGFGLYEPLKISGPGRETEGFADITELCICKIYADAFVRLTDTFK